MIMNTLPFSNLSENILLDTIADSNVIAQYNVSGNYSTNNDFLSDIDPDFNNSQNNINRQCIQYDTSAQFKQKFRCDKNISMLHTNICSSGKKLKDFIYYIDNLDITFTFIGICETWATKNNQDILNIPGYSHEQCIRSNNKRGGGVSIYVHNNIQYKNRKDLALPKTQYESVFIEINKSIMNTNRNVIIGEIYKTPSVKIK